jgi:hypothetical protein
MVVWAPGGDCSLAFGPEGRRIGDVVVAAAVKVAAETEAAAKARRRGKVLMVIR